MLIRCVLVAAWWVSASSYTPLSAVADDNDCALYLSGPGRTSAFDYNINLLRGNVGYDGQHTCITYEAVNAAYIDARKRIHVAQPKGDWKPEDIASAGELMLDISISLARTYGLTYEEIEKGLPLIDTSKTLIRDACPPIFSNVECRPGKYRRYDGLCNNLDHPTWGATMAPFQRLIGPLYADGINAPRVSVTGRPLPPSRVVSRTMHPDDGFHDHAGTVMVIAWGQFMDHDYTLTGTPLDPRNRNDPEECCKRPPHLKHPYCNEIEIPEDDYFYRLFNVKCIDFVRGFPSPRPGCRLGSRVQYNTLTGALDGNTVYGVTEKFARKLRTGFGGLLRMNPVFEEYGLKDLLPLKLDIPDEGCTRPNKSMFCFEAGEIRVNEQLVLTCMHTLMAREHNRLAKGLAAVNPHWDDETLYQESRRITIAEIQHITYNEFLPILLGKDVMEKFGLLLQKDSFWDGYDNTVNPDVIDAFAAAAYRFGHSLLPTAVERWSKAHKFIASKRLSDLIRRPYDLYRAGVFDEYLMGLMNQVAQAMDDSITQEVTNHLFKKVGARFGMDLVSFNMQRGREFGLPGYMEFRKFCGLPEAHTFSELFGSMPNETIRKYESIFEHPSDVDLWSGGVSERPLPGSMLGPTFACIIATQFSYSRRGDRFWYELPNQPSSFTPEQLIEVRKSRLSRIICDNTDIIDTVQVYPMVLPDPELNPRVPCRSGILPSIDFSKWAEHGTVEAAPSRPYITDATVNSNIPTVNVVDCVDVENLVPVDAANMQEIVIDVVNCADENSNLLNILLPAKNEKPIVEKTQGHYKNLLRKRRSSSDDKEEEATGKSARIVVALDHSDRPDDDVEIITTDKPIIPQKDEDEERLPQVFPQKHEQRIIHGSGRHNYHGPLSDSIRRAEFDIQTDHGDNRRDVEELAEDNSDDNSKKEKIKENFESENRKGSKLSDAYEDYDNENAYKKYPSQKLTHVQTQNNNSEDTQNTPELREVDNTEGNVKQQFEKIPLNYKHTDKTPNNENNKEISEEVKDKDDGRESKTSQLESDEGEKENDGESKETKETEEEKIAREKRLEEENIAREQELQEERQRYELEKRSREENMNYVHELLGLPEIRLPENVFEYYEPDDDDSDEEKKRKEDIREYPEEEKSEKLQTEEKKESDTEEEPGKEKEEEAKDIDPYDSDIVDDNVDLYEKFVHEHFNKKGTFAERAQKVVQEPSPYQSIVHEILNKTRATTKEAEASKDPNYGYSWNLEYGRPV